MNAPKTPYANGQKDKINDPTLIANLRKHPDDNLALAAFRAGLVDEQMVRELLSNDQEYDTLWKILKDGVTEIRDALRARLSKKSKER